MDAVNEDEILDIVDENDVVVGQAPRGEVYAKRLRHRAVFILARDAEDRIFVHRRTAEKLVFPSYYDMFVGGWSAPGRLRPGRAPGGVRGAGRDRPAAAGAAVQVPLRDAGAHWWSAVYEVRCTSPVAPQPEEVAWHAFLTREELEARLGEWQWVPDGFAAYQRLPKLA